MRHAPESKYDHELLAELNAEGWQVDLLSLNPSYCCWGPHEDYMSNNDAGWGSRKLIDSWTDYGPWELNDLNEIVNFYFSVNREAKDCESCGGTGYSQEAKKIADAWYDFNKTGKRWCDKITQDEVQALVDAGRLMDFTHTFERGKGWVRRGDLYIPTAKEVNDWEKGRGMGHDAINRSICIEARCKRLGIEKLCKACSGNGYIYTAEKAHVSLVLWMIHPRKGCSKGIEIKNISQSELPEIFSYLKNAADRNADRFSKVVRMCA